MPATFADLIAYVKVLHTPDVMRTPLIQTQLWRTFNETIREVKVTDDDIYAMDFNDPAVCMIMAMRLITTKWQDQEQDPRCSTWLTRAWTTTGGSAYAAYLMAAFICILPKQAAQRKLWISRCKEFAAGYHWLSHVYDSANDTEARVHLELAAAAYWPSAVAKLDILKFREAVIDGKKPSITEAQLEERFATHGRLVTGIGPDFAKDF